MDVKDNLEIGDIVPLYSKPFGKRWIKCVDIRYGVIVGFTNNGNPRAVPLYFNHPQLHDTTKILDTYNWIMKKSTVIPQAFKIENREHFLCAGRRRLNYNNLLSLLAKGRALKKKKVRKSTASYFTFD